MRPLLLFDTVAPSFMPLSDLPIAFNAGGRTGWVRQAIFFTSFQDLLNALSILALIAHTALGK